MPPAAQGGAQAAGPGDLQGPAAGARAGPHAWPRRPRKRSPRGRRWGPPTAPPRRPRAATNTPPRSSTPSASNWNTPTGLINDAQLAALTAEVRIQIDDDGTLRNPSLTRSSGNDLFDDSCLRAVRATGSVPPPPPAVRARVRAGCAARLRGQGPGAVIRFDARPEDGERMRCAAGFRLRCWGHDARLLVAGRGPRCSPTAGPGARPGPGRRRRAAPHPHHRSQPRSVPAGPAQRGGRRRRWPRRRRRSSGAALDIIGLFNLLNPTSFPPDLQREGMGFSSALWSQVGAQGVVKLRVAREGGGVTRARGGSTRWAAARPRC